MHITQIEFKLREIENQLCDEFYFSIPCILEINISNRLRCSNGRCGIWKNFLGIVYRARIVMSRALLDEFGWQAFETTFRHEMAHLANAIIHGERGHGESFKKLCRAFGGTMNKSLAGVRYSDCADTQYVKPIKKWEYHCPCGFVKPMAKRMKKGKRGSRFYSCRKCGCTLDKWIEKRLV